MEFRTGGPVKTTERSHILENFPGGGPQTPLSGDVPQFIHPSPLRGSGLLCPADGGLRHAPPTLPRSPPTLKVADNPGPWIQKSTRVECGLIWGAPCPVSPLPRRLIRRMTNQYSLLHDLGYFLEVSIQTLFISLYGMKQSVME